MCVCVLNCPVKGLESVAGPVRVRIVARTLFCPVPVCVCLFVCVCVCGRNGWMILSFGAEGNIGNWGCFELAGQARSKISRTHWLTEESGEMVCLLEELCFQYRARVSES